MTKSGRRNAGREGRGTQLRNESVGPGGNKKPVTDTWWPTSSSQRRFTDDPFGAARDVWFCVDVNGGVLHSDSLSVRP